ncbi:hypothetical protein [Pontibacter rugosus]
MKKNLYAFALTTSILGFASCSSPATEQADDRVEERKTEPKSVPTKWKMLPKTMIPLL